MRFTNYIKSIMLFALASLTIVSCSEDDSIVTEVKQETTEPGISIQVNNRTITSNAFAHYCSVNGKEGLSVSNKEELLATEINSTDFEADDFLFILNDDGTNSYSIGGTFFDKSVTGSQFDQIIFTTELDITVDSNDGSSVIGTMEGVLLGLDDDDLPTLELPISISYNAAIVGTSPICD